MASFMPILVIFSPLVSQQITGSHPLYTDQSLTSKLMAAPWPLCTGFEEKVGRAPTQGLRHLFLPWMPAPPSHQHSFSVSAIKDQSSSLHRLFDFWHYKEVSFLFVWFCFFSPPRKLSFSFLQEGDSGTDCSTRHPFGGALASLSRDSAPGAIYSDLTGLTLQLWWLDFQGHRAVWKQLNLLGWLESNLDSSTYDSTPSEPSVSFCNSISPVLSAEWGQYNLLPWKCGKT